LISNDLQYRHLRPRDKSDKGATTAFSHGDAVPAEIAPPIPAAQETH
jgi:hypothetical protein